MVFSALPTGSFLSYFTAKTYLSPTEWQRRIPMCLQCQATVPCPQASGPALVSFSLPTKTPLSRSKETMFLSMI